MTGSDEDDDDKALRVARLRLLMLDAIVAAQHRHQEVMVAVAAAADRDAALAAVATLLDVSEIQARAVLDMQWHNLTADRRRKAEEARDEILDWLAERQEGRVRPD